MTTPDDGSVAERAAAAERGAATERAAAAQRGAARERRILDEVFGQVLPDVTQDETDNRDGRDDNGGGDGEMERWYRENRPPHHG